jgi:chromosome partitioning protein
MPVIAVVNRKGGSGKSTLATHLAAWCSHAGIPVMLGDVDRQQSTQTWLRLREAQGLKPRASLVGWAVDPKRVLRPPAGVNHVILDTPGGLHGFDLARVVMCADAILLPVCNSVFDRQSSADCHAELMALPRVASGRCKVAAVGMRLDARTRATEVLAAWAADRGLPFLGALRETQAYVRCVEQGLTVFDLPGAQAEADRAQWQPILEWLEPMLHLGPAARAPADDARAVADGVTERRAATAAAGPAPSSRPTPFASGARPAPRVQAVTVDEEPAIRTDAQPASLPRARPSIATRLATALFGRLPLPRFRQRQA